MKNKWYHVFLRCVEPIMFSIVGATIGSAAAGLATTGFGIYQYRKGQAQLELLKGQEPKYEIPEEVRQNLTQAQLRIMELLPAEEVQLFVENIQRTMQSGLRTTKDRGLGMAGISMLAQQQTDAYRQLLGMQIAEKKSAYADLATARGTMAGFKEREFDINVMQPYSRDFLQAQAMMGAGTQNIYGGVQQALPVIGGLTEAATIA